MDFRTLLEVSSKEARLSSARERLFTPCCSPRPHRPGAQQSSVQWSLLRPMEKLLQSAVEKNKCQQKEQLVRRLLKAEGFSPEGHGCLSN